MAKKNNEITDDDDLSRRLDSMFDEDESDSPLANEEESLEDQEEVIEMVAEVDGTRSGETERSSEQAEEESVIPDDAPIKNLESIILGLEWEITDENMKEYISELDRLEEYFKSDSILTSFLKIQRSVGRYLRNRKGKAHRDSLRVLQSVFNEFAQIHGSTGMPENEKKKILLQEYNHFNALKKQILGNQPAAKSAVLQTSDMAQLKKEIQKIIKSEFELLKKELIQIIKEKA